MGLFSFFFPKRKTMRTTHEAETFRAVFRENEQLFQRIGQSEELRRFLFLEKEVNSEAFKQRRCEIERLSYKDSKYYAAEKRYKDLLKMRRLQSFRLVKGSEELKGYEQVRGTAEYREYEKLRVIVKSSEFDRKLHASEVAAYKKLLANPQIAAAAKFENMRRYKKYCEVLATPLPAEFEQLETFIRSDEFKNNRRFLLDKHRYRTTDDYKLFEEYETLKKREDIRKYFALASDACFANMCRWQLVLEDHFDKGALDTTRWITRYYAGERFLNDTYGVGSDVQLYMPDNITFGSSSLVLNFRNEQIVGKYWDAKMGIRERQYDYTSGMVSTAVSFRQRYGRFEAKIRLNRCPVTSCFWLVGEKLVPHIEVMMCNNQGVYAGHAFVQQTQLKQDTTLLKQVPFANDYYIFTLEWTADKLVWMVNDMVVKEVTEHIPDCPMYLGFSLGAAEAPADKMARMEIDWVRVYRLKE